MITEVCFVIELPNWGINKMMKLINVYYKIKYRLNEDEDLKGVTVKNPDTGHDVLVTSVLNNPDYKDTPVLKAAQDKVASLKKDADKKPQQLLPVPTKDDLEKEKQGAIARVSTNSPDKGIQQRKQKKSDPDLQKTLDDIETKIKALPKDSKDTGENSPAELKKRVDVLKSKVDKPTSPTSPSNNAPSDRGATKKPPTHMSVADVAKEEKAKKEADKKEKDKKEIKNVVTKNFSKLSGLKEDDVSKLIDEPDAKKRAEQIKKLKPDMKEEDINMANDLLDVNKSKETMNQLEEAYPKEMQDLKTKGQKVEDALNKAGKYGWEATKLVGKTVAGAGKVVGHGAKVAGMTAGLGIAGILGLGIFGAGAITNKTFGLAAKILDTVAAMATGTMGSDR